MVCVDSQREGGSFAASRDSPRFRPPTGVRHRAAVPYAGVDDGAVFGAPPFQAAGAAASSRRGATQGGRMPPVQPAGCRRSKAVCYGGVTAASSDCELFGVRK
jgi:hypothetical protein